MSRLAPWPGPATNLLLSQAMVLDRLPRRRSRLISAKARALRSEDAARPPDDAAGPAVGFQGRPAGTPDGAGWAALGGAQGGSSASAPWAGVPAGATGGGAHSLWGPSGGPQIAIAQPHAPGPAGFGAAQTPQGFGAAQTAQHAFGAFGGAQAGAAQGGAGFGQPHAAADHHAADTAAAAAAAQERERVQRVSALCLLHQVPDCRIPDCLPQSAGRSLSITGKKLRQWRRRRRRCVVACRG